MAEIHPKLLDDCIILGRFQLCHLLLMNDRNYPWCILVPDRDNTREIYELDAEDRQQLLSESCLLSEFLMGEFRGDKLNVAALGNQVPQLHLHHIVRFETDPAWPAPVWGRNPPLPYTDDALAEFRSLFALARLEGFETHLDG